MKDNDTRTPPIATVPSSPRRRRLLAGTAASVGGFFGPWSMHRAWAQAAAPKPLVIGLTMDASGQYGASGGMERLGAMMAIKEFNDKGGVLGRPIEAIHMDTETTPATGSRVAERMINRNDAAFMVGAVHSGVANAISTGGAEVRLHLPQHQLQLADRSRQGLPPREVRVGRQRHQLRARPSSRTRSRPAGKQLGAADQRLRVGPQHRQGDARASSMPTTARSSRKCWCRRTRATSRPTC